MLALVIPFAILNRARGTKLFGKTTSTVIGRLVATWLMALLILFVLAIEGKEALWGGLYAWGTLMLWCTPGWDAEWAATIGNDPIHSRIWGLYHLIIRMQLILPFFLGMAYFFDTSYFWALGSLTLGLPYYIAGYASKLKPILYAELGVGALIALFV